MKVCPRVTYQKFGIASLGQPEERLRLVALAIETGEGAGLAVARVRHGAGLMVGATARVVIAGVGQSEKRLRLVPRPSRRVCWAATSDDPVTQPAWAGSPLRSGTLPVAA